MKLITLIFIFSTTVFGNFRLDSEPKQVAEKVYLHIDRNVYSSGDDIWFKAYVINPSTNKLSINTNNLHVELIAPDSRIIKSATLRIQGGLGNGDFHLPDSLISGQYLFRAYTNYMRNYDQQFFFRKEITLINPDDKTIKSESDTLFVENKIELTFYPEGSSLVDNVYSTIAFKAINSLGKGCEVNGILYSNSGALGSFKSVHMGMGSFHFKPLPGQHYYAIVKSQDGTQTRAVLPESFHVGLTMSAFFNDENKLFITVKTNKETLPTVTGHNLTLLLSSRNLIKKTTTIKIDSLENNFILPIEDLPDGIIKITLSGIEGLPLCERLVYYQKVNNAFLDVVTDKNEYKPREKVTVNLSLSGGSTITGIGYFSLSAAEDRFSESSVSNPSSIASWYLLESDVHGPVEEPSYYFDPSNKDRFEKLDLLLLTQGWRDFQWKYDSLSAFKHEIGFTLTGKVKRTVRNIPIEGARINMVIYGNSFNSSMDTKTDSTGKFRFENIDLIGKGTVIISVTDRSERSYGRLYLDSLVYQPAEVEKTASFPIMNIVFRQDFDELKEKTILKNTIKKNYKLTDTIELEEVLILEKKPETFQEKKTKESRSVYGKPDVEVEITPAMDNFAGDVFDLIAGRVPSASVMKSGDNISIVVRGPNDGALILLDGIEVALDYIRAIPVSLIDRIDVLYASPAYGMRGANGVINIITRFGMRPGSVELTSDVTVTDIMGFYSPRIFFSPKYDSPLEPNIPHDTRTTIFWEPNITTETNEAVKLEYFNADNSGKIYILVEGITEAGTPISSKAIYEVKDR